MEHTAFDRELFVNYKGIKDKTYTCVGCGCDIAFKGHGHNHKYCSNACQGQARKQKELENNKTLFEQGLLTPRRLIYKQLVLRDGNKCQVCGITEWNNQPIRLWVDHIDGDASNNNPENFRLICPNCDSQSDTFGAKNLGNGRKSRGMRMYG